jgi:hypothetical protein
MSELSIQEQLIELIKDCQRLHYQNSIYRGILELTNPPGWRDRYAQEINDWDHQHALGSPFHEAISELEHWRDPETLLKALLSRTGWLKPASE